MRGKARKLYMAIALALATMVVTAGAVFAIVTFDSATGEGFAGKGDVQKAFNLNNKQMQAVHEQIQFKYVATATYEFDCEWYTGPDHNLKRHQNTKTAETEVNASIAADGKKTGQWTGWFLTGYDGGAQNSAGEPTDADCGAEGSENKTIVPGSVELISSSGGLYAVHPDGREALLQ